VVRLQHQRGPQALRVQVEDTDAVTGVAEVTVLMTEQQELEERAERQAGAEVAQETETPRMVDWAVSEPSESLVGR
tara:strand:+ start:738 stop:965 length:228 start_codon:yes stop_codon:yes gene_type:complete